MLPTATPAGTTLATTAAIPAARDNPLRFYVRMAYACAIIAVAGFTPTYWAPVTAGAFRGPSVLHLHGLLFTAWTVLFVVQARLAAADRYERHRALGLAGIALATAMVFAGILVAVSSMRAGVAQGAGDEARAFSIVPITIIAFFAAIFAAAIANSRRPEIHMRLMLVASVTLLPPAFARVVRLFVVGFDAGTSTGLMGNPPPLAMTPIPNLAADVLLLVAIVHDWRTRGRPHAAYVIPGVCLVVLQFVRIPLAGTDAWMAVTGWLLNFGG